MVVIVVVGVGLIVYSRNEALNPASKTTTEGPTASDNWNAALSFDLCGTEQPALAANSSNTATGIRTFGTGLINITPAAATTPADFEGKKATLGLFISKYGDNLTLTNTTLRLAGGKKTWKNGDACSGATTGPGKVQVRVWSSPTLSSSHLVTTDPGSIHLTNGMMISVAFVPAGTTIPAPSSRSTLISTVGNLGSSSSSTTSSTTTTTTPSKKKT